MGEQTDECSLLTRGGRVTRRHSQDAGRRQGQVLVAPGGWGETSMGTEDGG